MQKINKGYREIRDERIYKISLALFLIFTFLSISILAILKISQSLKLT